MSGYESNVGRLPPDEEERYREIEEAKAARLQQEFDDGMAQRRPLSNAAPPRTSNPKRRRPNVRVEEEDLYTRVEEEDLYTRVEELKDKIQEIENMSTEVPANQFGSLDSGHTDRILKQIAFARKYSENLKDNAEEVLALLKKLNIIEQGILKPSASFFGRGGRRKTRRSQRSRKNKSKNRRR